MATPANANDFIKQLMASGKLSNAQGESLIRSTGGFTGAYGDNNGNGIGDATEYFTGNANSNSAVLNELTRMGLMDGTGGGTQSAFVAPFSEWQDKALNQMATPNTAGQQYFDQAGGYLSQIGSMLMGAAQNPSAGDFNQWYNTFQNDFQNDVVNSTIGRINDAGDVARSRISAAAAKIGRTGDSASALQMSELDKNIAQQVAETTGGLNYQGFQSAAGMAQNQINQNRSGTLQALSAGMQLPQIASGLGTTAYNQNASNIQNLLTAGNLVQRQDQNYLNAAANEFGQMTGGYDDQRLAQLQNLLTGLSPYFTGAAGPSPTSPNTASRIGNVLNVGGSAVSYLNTPTVNNLPWTTPGNVNPFGGYYS